MNKTHKKLDKQIIEQLTIACESAKEELPQFLWLTHEVSYQKFPKSLLVTCMFDTWEAAHDPRAQQLLTQFCQEALRVIQVTLTPQQIQFHKEP